MQTLDCAWQDSYGPHVPQRCQVVALEQEHCLEGHEVVQVEVGGQILQGGGIHTASLPPALNCFVNISR